MLIRRLIRLPQELHDLQQVRPHSTSFVAAAAALRRASDLQAPIRRNKSRRGQQRQDENHAPFPFHFTFPQRFRWVWSPEITGRTRRQRRRGKENSSAAADDQCLGIRTPTRSLVEKGSLAGRHQPNVYIDAMVPKIPLVLQHNYGKLVLMPGKQFKPQVSRIRFHNAFPKRLIHVPHTVSLWRVW